MNTSTFIVAALSLAGRSGVLDDAPLVQVDELAGVAARNVEIDTIVLPGQADLGDFALLADAHLDEVAREQTAVVVVPVRIAPHMDDDRLRSDVLQES